MPLPSVVGRLAPSPTGALHLGNARTFLLGWLSVRSRGGRLILRMEDLDHPKVKPSTAQQALEDLRWLGLDWDEGPDCGGPNAPYVQSQRIEHYAEALQALRAQNLLYPCTCSRRDVETAQSAPHASDAAPRYPGTCRGRYASYDDATVSLPAGRLPAWRFRATDGPTTYTDAIHGQQAVDVPATTGDFVVARHAHGAGYMLAVVVDDAAMGVTEVLRADDLLETTASQIQLQAALQLPRPSYCHVPLVVAPDGRRLAKRHGDTRISTYRRAGLPAKRILGLLAWWSGLADWGEEPPLEVLLERYDAASIPREPAILTPRILAVLENGYAQA